MGRGRGGGHLKLPLVRRTTSNRNTTRATRVDIHVLFAFTALPHVIHDPPPHPSAAPSPSPSLQAPQINVDVLSHTPPPPLICVMPPAAPSLSSSNSESKRGDVGDVPPLLGLAHEAWCLLGSWGGDGKWDFQILARDACLGCGDGWDQLVGVNWDQLVGVLVPAKLIIVDKLVESFFVVLVNEYHRELSH